MNQIIPLIKPETRILEQSAIEVAKSVPADVTEGIYRSITDELSLYCPQDNCDWTDRGVNYDTVLAYHNTKCPRCNTGVIITDDELIQFVTLREIQKHINTKPVPKDKSKLQTHRAVFDSNVGEFKPYR